MIHNEQKSMVVNLILKTMSSIKTSLFDVIYKLFRFYIHEVCKKNCLEMLNSTITRKNKYIECEGFYLQNQ